MIKRTFKHIFSMLAGELLAVESSGGDYDSLLIEGVSTDTRTLQPGNLFIPLNVGNTFDGHDFVKEAFAKGAVAALWQKGHADQPEGLPLILVEDPLQAFQHLAKAYRSELPVRVIGITGSNGKTSTKDITAAILATTYRVHKTQGTFNNHIGLPLTILLLDEDTEMAVIEMGMSGRGEIRMLTEIAQPEAVIITNIGESHLLQLGSREEIARAKTEILSGLRDGGLFVYNGDEPLIEQVVPEMAQPASMLRFRFGSQPSNDIYPVVMLQENEGTQFKVNLPDSPVYFIPVLGKHNVINALAAIAVSKYMGVSDADIVDGLKGLELSSMRIEMTQAKSGAMILNDAYNASPTSMRAAVELLQDLKGYHRKIIVLGDMLSLGDKEVEFHREIGQLLQPGSIDLVYTCGALAKHIAAAANEGYDPEQVHWFANRKELIQALRNAVHDGDIVLVKGSRGMMLEEVVQALLEVSNPND